MVNIIKRTVVPYWIDKSFEVDFYWRTDDKNINSRELKVSLWSLEYSRDDDEWYCSWWKHILLLTLKINRRTNEHSDSRDNNA